MKKITWILFSFSLVHILASWGFTSEPAKYPPDIRRIKQRGTLIVAMYYQDIPPFFMHNEQGKFQGLDVKLARDIAQKLNVELKFHRQAKTFEQIIDILVQQKADVAISLLSKTLHRAQKVRYTQPYIVLHQGLLINRVQLNKLAQKQNILTTLNQPKCHIGVKQGTSYEHFAQNIFPKAKVVTYPDWEPYIVQSVVQGPAVAGFHDEIEVKKYLLSRPEASIQATTAVIQDLQDPIAMAVPWDSHALLDWLNIYIHNQVQDWDADKLLQKYMPSIKDSSD